MAPVVKIPAEFEGAIQAIYQRIPKDSILREPKIGIVCGSGLSGLASRIRDSTIVPYSEIPGFGTSTGGYTIMHFARPRAYLNLKY